MTHDYCVTVAAVAGLLGGGLVGAMLVHIRAVHERRDMIIRTVDAWIHFEHPGPMPDLGPYRSSEAPGLAPGDASKGEP